MWWGSILGLGINSFIFKGIVKKPDAKPTRRHDDKMNVDEIEIRKIEDLKN